MIKNYLKKLVLHLITLLAIANVRRHKPYIIAITGNLGKTSTKNNIVAVLSDYNIIYSKKSYNSEFGIPLAILKSNSGLHSTLAWMRVIWNGIKLLMSKAYADYLILEVGADKKGDIELVSRWLRPNVVVMTQFAKVPVHVENYKNRDELVREKRYLLEALRQDGLFIYNADCEDSSEMAKYFGGKSISFGIKYGDYMAGTITNSLYDGKVTANIKGPNSLSILLELYDVIGEAAILCALPAIIIGDVFGIETGDTVAKLSRHVREPGRMRLLPGINDSYIIDDSYNSSPLAVESGLRALRNISGRHRKIVVLGDMLELGQYTSAEHKRIGEIAATSCDILVTVGGRSRLAAESAKSAGMRDGYVLECKTSQEAGKAVREILMTGDIVYVKGSQGMRMEKATASLVSDAVDSKNDLPRQEDEWINS